eukprot:scaffold7356_cov249-Pinguiococcus_pyrenoidosus.AAC.7
MLHIPRLHPVVGKSCDPFVIATLRTIARCPAYSTLLPPPETAATRTAADASTKAAPAAGATPSSGSASTRETGSPVRSVEPASESPLHLHWSAAVDASPLKTKTSGSEPPAASLFRITRQDPNQLEQLRDREHPKARRFSLCALKRAEDHRDDEKPQHRGEPRMEAEHAVLLRQKLLKHLETYRHWYVAHVCCRAPVTRTLRGQMRLPAREARPDVPHEVQRIIRDGHEVLPLGLAALREDRGSLFGAVGNSDLIKQHAQQLSQRRCRSRENARVATVPILSQQDHAQGERLLESVVAHRARWGRGDENGLKHPELDRRAAAVVRPGRLDAEHAQQIGHIGGADRVSIQHVLDARQGGAHQLRRCVRVVAEQQIGANHLLRLEQLRRRRPGAAELPHRPCILLPQRTYPGDRRLRRIPHDGVLLPGLEVAVEESSRECIFPNR